MSTETPTAPLPATFADFKPPERKGAIDKVRYSHKAMVDMIVANPWISQAELARNFGYTEGWVSQVIASDAFQAHLETRKDELIDPHIRATIEERFKGLVARSIEILMRKLENNNVEPEVALKALEVAARAAGYGARSAQVQVNTQFVVQVPAKAVSSESWADQHKAGGPAVVNSPEAKSAEKIEDATVLVEPRPAADTQSLLNQLKGG